MTDRRQWLAATATVSLGAALAPRALLAQVPADKDRPDSPPDEVRRRRPSARLAGRGTLRFLGLHIYDALLWVEQSFDGGNYAAHPIALELRYARSLYGSLIAERSLREMERAGPIPAAQSERWLAFMREAFPDVGAGDRITGLWAPADETSEFIINGKSGKALRDRAFGERFFGIWLSAATSEPALRQALLGRKGA
ncbi:MAG: chalcone isomerase family protein [Burkholderiales bacterium]|nr:chalcone isomerase family protein [Burkholderiales bacterium]